MTKWLNALKLTHTVGFLVFFQLLGNSQPNQNIHFLHSVGVLDSVYSHKDKEYKEFFVQLPASYDASRNEKYPVVFILDGELLLPTVHNVQNFYSGGFMPEMVLIGISNSNHRTRDLTPSKVEDFYGYETGGANDFSTFLETELLPFIEQKYPVTNFRTLIGHSYGGLFTINTLIHHPQLFSNYIAIDPSLDWDNQKLITESQGNFSEDSHQGKSLFISLAGQLHMQKPQMTIDEVKQDTSSFTSFPRANLHFLDIIKQNEHSGLTHEWKFYPQDLHGTIPLPAIMDGLISVFKWYQMKNIHKFNIPTTPIKELESIIRSRSQRLEKHFGYKVPPYPDFLLTMKGYMSMDMNKMDLAKMFFEFAITYYPDTPNSYDSMADYYKRIGDNDKAIMFVTKAYEISGDDYYKKRIEDLKK